MPAAVASVGTPTETNATTASVNMGTAPPDGNLLVMWVMWDISGGATLTNYNGWTSRDPVTVSGIRKYEVVSKVASGEGTTVTGPTFSTSVALKAICQRITDHDGFQASNYVLSTVTEDDNTHISSPSRTASQADTLALIGAGQASVNAGSLSIVTAGATLDSQAATGGYTMACGHKDALLANGGTSGAIQWAYSAFAGDTMGATTLLVKSAATSGPSSGGQPSVIL